MLIAENVSMTKRAAHFGYVGKKPPVHFIRHWREYRGLTQEAVCELAGMTTNNLSQLENYQQGWSPEGLARLAEALKTTPGSLLQWNPLLEGADVIWEMWNQATDDQRGQLTSIASTIVRPGRRS